MDGFKRSRPRTGGPSASTQPRSTPVSKPTPVSSPQPTTPTPPQIATADETSAPEKIDTVSAPRPRRSKKWLILAIVGLIFVAVAVLAYLWYGSQTTAVDANDTTTQRFEVKEGSSFSDVTAQLHERGLIRSPLAFDIYARLHGHRSNLKASTCSLKKSQSAGEILDKLVAGCHDFVSVTFYPGATIEQPLYKPESATMEQTMYVKYRLKQAGFSDEEINAALAKQYDSPIFANKPTGTTLEGYVFGETYYVDKSSTAEDVLKETFVQMDKVLARNDIVAKFKAQGLNLYEGITLASIVQRELNCEDKPTKERKDRCYGYQREIAQVFLKRLREGTSLGSDVTFIYAADMMKVFPSVDLDSPYNTRIHTGLPPGPIASPGELALKAVANPTDTNHLFFIAGDDGLIYFADTNAEHEANIRDHCQILCSEL